MAPRESKPASQLRPAPLSADAARRLLAAQPADPAPKETGKDLIARAKGIHAEYQKARYEYVAWMDSEQMVEIHFVRFWTKAISDHNPNLKPFVNYGRMAQEMRSEEREAKGRRAKYELKAVELGELMLKPDFWKQLLELPDSTQDQTMSELVEDLGQSFAGCKILDDAFKKRSSTKWDAVFKADRKFLTAFWKFLGEVAPFWVAKGRAQAIVDVGHYVALKVPVPIKLRTLEDLARLPKRHVFVDAARVHGQVSFLGAIEVDPKASTKEIKALCDKAVDTVNLAIALWTLYDAYQPAPDGRVKTQTKEIVSVVSAVASLTDKFDKTYEALAKVKLAGKFGERATKVTCLGVIGGICDMITGGMDTARRIETGDYKAAAAYAGVVVGGFLTVGGSIAVVLTTAGGLTAWTGWGLLAVAAGAAVSGLGTLGGYLWDPKPVELWVRHNRYGNEHTAGHADYKHWVGNVRAQIDFLGAALWNVEIKSGTGTGDFVIGLYGVQRHSTIKLELDVEWFIEGERRHSFVSGTDGKPVYDGDFVAELHFHPSPPSRDGRPHTGAQCVGVKATLVFEPPHAMLEHRGSVTIKREAEQHWTPTGW
jgi:hypothetical protein